MENATLAVINLEVSAEELKTFRVAALKKVSANAEIPGFRKGKAPVDKIEKQFAGQITEDLIDDVVKKYYGEILEKEQLHVVSQPGLSDMDLDAGKFEFKVEILPKAKIGQYKGLEVEKGSVNVSNESVEQEIERIAKAKVDLEAVEASAEMGDTVTIDFEGFVDGVPFEGGRAEKYDLKLGSHSFIDTFEEQIVGKKAGEEFDVNVVFPAEYHSKALAGKPSMFKIVLHAVKREKSVEVNDEFAVAQGFENLTDMKTKKHEELTTRETNKIEKEFEDKIIQAVMATSEIHVPASLVQNEVERNIRQFEQQLQMQGMNLDSYLSMTKTKREDMIAQLTPNSESQLKLDILLSEVAELESIQVDEAELQGEIEKIITAYKMTKEQFEEQLKSVGNYETFLQNLVYERKARKAVECIVANTVVKG